jgi:hypothetical protein
MKLDIHPNAARNFNNKADALLLELITETKAQFFELYIKPGTFTFRYENLFILDAFGYEIGRFSYVDQNVLIGLKSEGFLKFKTLSENMQRTKVLSDRANIIFIADSIFEWIKNKYTNSTDLSMTDFVFQKFRNNLEEVEIWIPVPQVSIQSEIKLGKITFKTISGDLIDSWSTSNELLKQFFSGKRKKFQGFAAATIKLTAEPKKAFEIAQEEAEKSISLLRIFSPAFSTAKVTSYCVAPMDRQNIEPYLMFYVIDNKLSRITIEGLQPADQWLLNNSVISQIEPCIKLLDKVLLLKKHTEFQTVVLYALKLYSLSSISQAIEDKLVYILISLEVVLLRNEQEPISQNIGERIAFFISEKGEERRAIVKQVKSIYSLRSKFIHHGQNLNDLKIMESFMINARLFFQKLILSINQFKTKEQFLSNLEEIKFS